jgi:tetratricopeptide (TPR) repeat protein
LGIDGDKALGIRQLNLTVNKGTYSKIEAMFFLGAIYTYREKDYGKALAIWHKLIYKFPNNSGILIHMGRCYGDMGNCAKALQIYKQIIYIIDRSTLIPISSVNYQLGRIQYKSNQFDDAVKSFHKSVESDTGYAGHHRWTYPWSHYFLGLSYDMIGDRVKSKYHYQQVNDDHSDYVYKLTQERLENPLDSVSREIMKGKNHIGCREYEKGLRILQGAGSELHNQDSVYTYLKWSEIRYYVGQIRYFQTRYEEAISIFDELLKDESIEDEWFIDWVYYYRGNCHRNLGNNDLASRDYERAEDSDNIELPSKVERAQQLLKAQ